MTFAWIWLALELRRRWRSLAALMVLVAIASAVVLTAMSAARRGASALTRLQHRTLPATVDVLANVPGFDWSKVRALPEVAALSNFVVDYLLEVKGVDGNGIDFPFVDAAMFSTLERPVILSGRNLDPARADEVVVSPKFLASYHEHVGSTLVLQLPSAHQLDASFAQAGTPSRFDGPEIPLRIVGVGVSPWFVDQVDTPGGIQLSPALAQKYRAEIVGTPGPQNTQFINALVRLKNGERDVARFRADFATLTGRHDIYIGDLGKDEAVVQRRIAFQSRCLVAFALAALVAALFLVGQAIARYAASSAAELRTLQALGLTPRAAVAAATSAPLAAGAIGAAVGAVGSYVASALFPFGTARYYESDRGRSFDALVTSFGLVFAVLAVAVGAGLAARSTVRARSEATRRSVIAAAVARSGAPTPIAVGTHFALERGVGRSAVPVRPALVGSMIGVLGTVAAFTFSHGVSDAAHHPARFGQTYQLIAFLGLEDQNFVPAAAVYRTLAADSDVSGIADSRTAVATDPSGTSSVSLWEFQTRPKPIEIVLLSGRKPRTAGEVALAPRTLSFLHAHVGGRITLHGNRAGAPHTYTITGSALVPSGPHNSYADGGWVTPSGYDAIFTGFKFHIALVSLRPGVSAGAAATRLTHVVTTAVPQAAGIGIAPPDPLSEVKQIQQVEVLPIVLGFFLALLAVGAVGHALASAVRRRSRDLAVLRAIGMTRGQCRVVVITQATVLALFGLVFGVPLGVAAGRTVWRTVADYTPVEYVPPLAVWALALVGPAALLLANLLAAWPGQRAARLRVARVLRAE